MSSNGNRHPQSGWMVLASGFRVRHRCSCRARYGTVGNRPAWAVFRECRKTQRNSSFHSHPFPARSNGGSWRWVEDFAEQLAAALLDLNTAGGYIWQLRLGGQPFAGAARGFAKQPVDGSEPWTESIRMHIASLSKLVTGIAMARTLNAHNLAASTTKIIDYLPFLLGERAEHRPDHLRPVAHPQFRVPGRRLRTRTTRL